MRFSDFLIQASRRKDIPAAFVCHFSVTVYWIEPVQVSAVFVVPLIVALSCFVPSAVKESGVLLLPDVTVRLFPFPLFDNIAEGVEDTSMVSPKDPVLHCTEILYVLVISTLPVGIFV